MATVLAPLFKQKFFGNDGKPLVGGKLFTYIAGTSTKTPTYTSSTGSQQNTNPVILDYRGEANVWLLPNTGYKFVLSDGTDTDPPARPIWSVDQVRDSQLLTLYGGVDTGVANSYVLNFTAPFTSLQDGIVIYWVPANTNTGASTLNVNGLGPVPIVNPLGGALIAGQIIAGQFAAVAYQSGSFTLLSFNNIYLTGSFSGTLTGCTTSPSASFDWVRNGNLISLYCNTGLVAVSNTTSMTITGLPASIRPTFGRNIVCLLQDNGTNMIGWVNVGPSGTMTFAVAGGAGGFTSSGNKGIGGNWAIQFSL